MDEWWPWPHFENPRIEEDNEYTFSEIPASSYQLKTDDITSESILLFKAMRSRKWMLKQLFSHNIKRSPESRGRSQFAVPLSRFPEGMYCPYIDIHRAVWLSIVQRSTATGLRCSVPNGGALWVNRIYWPWNPMCHVLECGALTSVVSSRCSRVSLPTVSSVMEFWGG